VTSLFTWDLPEVCLAVNSLKNTYGKAEIRVGGVGASAIPEYVEKMTGISPFIGIMRKVENCAPDYLMSKETRESEDSLVFTTRGCPWKCKYCVVRMIEPEYYEMKGWERAIAPSKKRIVLFDNNILRAKKKHFNRVMKILYELDKEVDINSGFDCRLLTEEHVKKIVKLRIKPIRLAFDKMEQEKPLIKSVNLFKKHGIRPDAIRVYVLYNYKDDLKEARYRADKVIELGCKPFAMRYKPLDWLSKQEYIAKPKWSMENIVNFTYYYNMPAVWNTISYDKFIEERKNGNFETIRKEMARENNKVNKVLFS
jgi:hypothetical protein